MRRPVTLALALLAAVIVAIAAGALRGGPAQASGLPRLLALPAHGQPGVGFRLRFRLRAQTPPRLVGLTITVYHGRQAHPTLSKTFPLGRLSSNLYGVAYSSAGAVQGRFCVRAFDAAGHHGRPACARLVVSAPSASSASKPSP